jgi:HPt (histidine-containing phosphotransfer) domain-containing protein
LLQRCLGNLDFAERILNRFTNTFRDGVAEIRLRENAADANGVARAAHKLKGGAANVSAPGLSNVLKRVEEAGQAGNLAMVAEHMAELEQEWTRFLASSQSELTRRRQ